MSSVSVLLESLRARGIEVSAAGDKLKTVAPKGALTPELVEGLRAHKAELLALLRELPAANHTPSVPMPRAEMRDRYALSPVQARNVFQAHRRTGLPTAFRLRGPLDVACLTRTLETIVQRHAPLRTRFELSGDEFMQRVEPAPPLALSVESIEADGLTARLAELVETTFDLEVGPPYRFVLLALSPVDHVFFMAVSAVIFDGWSFDVFLSELREGYAALARGDAWPFPPIAAEYVDCLAWLAERSARRGEEDRAFWLRELGAVLPRGPLPLDRPRLPIPTHRGGSIPFSLDRETADALRAWAQAHETTLQIVMLAALHAFVAKLGGVERTIVATPIEGRMHPAMEPLVGSFVQMLLVPARVAVDESFESFASSLKRRCLALYEHQDQPLEELGLQVERGTTRGMVPLWQVEFSYQQVETRGTLMGPLSLSQVELPAASAMSELIVWVKDWGHTIGGAIDFAEDVLDRDTVLAWRELYVEALRAIARDPSQPLAAITSHVTTHERPRTSTAPRALEAVTRRSEPLDPVEHTLMRIFTRALGIETPLQGDFFELGGHSLAGVRLLVDVHREFGVTFALGVLFEAPTPFALAKHVRRELGRPDPDTGEGPAGSVAWSPIVPIHPRGSRPPLFVVAGVGGNPMNLRHVARALGEDQPFYGLQHRGTDGRLAPHASVADTADEYAASIEAIAPTGPILLGGFSAGGVAAYETGQRLRARGRDVRLVVMFDANSPFVRLPTRQERMQHHLDEIGRDGLSYVGRAARRRIDKTSERVRLRAEAWLARIAPYRFRNAAVTMACVDANKRYLPAPYDGDVLVLRASIRDNFVFDESNGWAPLVRGRLVVTQVEGGHTSHVLEDFAPSLAVSLGRAIDEALG